MTQQRGLTRAQIARLTKAVDPTHVDKKQGLSYMAQHEVRAELTRIFGFGNWDSQVESMDLLWEDSYEHATSKKTMYRACYQAAVRLTIRDYWGNQICSFVEWHAEANSGLPDRGEAYAMAITSVESYALRRAAIGLGDRLGLGLYNNGETTPLVKGTLQLTDVDSPLYQAPKPTEAPAEKSSSQAQSPDRIARLQAVTKAMAEPSAE
jgi:recombination DNA repair RAD52 pathway protein